MCFPHVKAQKMLIAIVVTYLFLGLAFQKHCPCLVHLCLLKGKNIYSLRVSRFQTSTKPDHVFQKHYRIINVERESALFLSSKTLLIATVDKVKMLQLVMVLKVGTQET